MATKSLDLKLDALSEADIDRLVRMGWEDRSTFEAIDLPLFPNEQKKSHCREQKILSNFNY